MRNATLRGLVETDDPVSTVWEALYDLWADTPGVDDFDEHYGGRTEERSSELEWQLYQIYTELYTEVLPERCVREASLSVPDDTAVVVMDGASVREAPLFASALAAAGYETSVSFEYATVPSDTVPFKQRVDYEGLTREYETAEPKSMEPSLSGDERLVWVPYPDRLIENVQEGRVEIGDVATAGEQSVAVLRRVVDQLDADRVVVRSDHGYTRLGSGLGFPVADGLQSRAREVFGGSRSVSVADADLSDLEEHGIVTEFDGQYLGLGRYTWPISGKYSTYEHGGMGLTEVLTPWVEATI